MPLPAAEWILKGNCELVLPHLTLIAPRIVWNDEHFHVCALAAANEHEPQLFHVQLGESPVGAINFLPLPDTRTLMRLYRCSDLGETCTRADGDAVALGFFGALLTRLGKLGFLVEQQETAPERALGFRAPGPQGS